MGTTAMAQPVHKFLLMLLVVPCSMAWLWLCWRLWQVFGRYMGWER